MKKLEIGQLIAIHGLDTFCLIHTNMLPTFDCGTIRYIPTLDDAKQINSGVNFFNNNKFRASSQKRTLTNFHLKSDHFFPAEPLIT